MAEEVTDLARALWGEGAALAIAIFFMLVGAIAPSAFAKYQQIIADGGAQRDRLLARLAAGGDPWSHYRNRIRGILDTVDRWIKDQDWKRRGRDHPDWNGKLFNLCAVLCVLYPVASITLTWIVAGDAGPVGAALNLHEGAGFIPRSAVALALLSVVVCLWCRSQRRRLLAVAFFFLAIAVGIFGVQASRVFPGGASEGILYCAVFSAGFGIALSYLGANVGAGAFAGGFVGALSYSIMSLVSPLQGVVAGAVAALVIVAVALGVWLVERRKRLGPFWLFYFPLAVAGAYAGQWLLAADGQPTQTLVMLSFLSIVSLANLPFDWFSVGLTRRLLRWGLEPRAPHPLVIASLDFALSLIILLLLGAATIVALHAVNTTDMIAGARPSFPLHQIFAELRRNPGHPGHSWIYFTLFSTLAPSLFNVLVGTVSLMTSARSFSRGVAREIEQYVANPLGETAIPRSVAFKLTAVWVVGVILVFFGFSLLVRLVFAAPDVGAGFLNAYEMFAGWSEPIVQEFVRAIAEGVGIVTPQG